MLTVNPDKDNGFIFLRHVTANFHVVPCRVFAVIDHIPADLMKEAVVKLKSFPFERVLQSCQRVITQVVVNTQYMGFWCMKGGQVG